MKDPIEWEATLPIRPSSPAWRTVVKATYGTELTAAELELFRQLSGGREPPEGGCDELEGVIGRRGGKSEQIARMAVFEAVHGGHSVALAPGQLAIIPIISPLREQGQQIHNYACGLARLPEVAPFVDGEPTKDSIKFKTGVEIKIMTCDAVNVSGPTVVMAIRDEWAKFPGADAATPDFELDNSLRPALAPVIGAPRRRLIGITSAYIQEGLAYDTDQQNFGHADSPLLVVRGQSSMFNPALDQAWLDKERKRIGALVFAREYLGIWQPAIVESWFGSTAIERARSQRGILPSVARVRYVAGLDLGCRVDGAALSICHREKRGVHTVTVVDGVWFWPAGTLSMMTIVSRAAAIIRQYNNAIAYADQFHFDTVKDDFAKARVRLIEAPWTGTGGKSKTIRFNTVRNQMADGRVELPNDPDLFKEFHSLSGRLRRSGTEELAARTGTDDRVHATVIAISEALEHFPDRNPPSALTGIERLERERQRQAVGAALGFELPPPDTDEQIDPEYAAMMTLLTSIHPELSEMQASEAAILLTSNSAAISLNNRSYDDLAERRQLRAQLEAHPTKTTATEIIRSLHL